jgi:WD40 repeat protein
MAILPDGVTPANSLTGAPRDTYYVAWSADGRWLAAEGSRGAVALWSPDSNRAPVLTRSYKGGERVSLGWHPSKPLLIVVSDGGQLWILDAATGQERKSKIGRVRLVAWLADGDSFVTSGEGATGGGEGIITVRDATTIARTRRLSTHSITSSLRTLPDGRSLLCGQENGTVELIDLAGPRRYFAESNGPVRGLSLSPDGLRFACAADDGTIRVRPLHEGRSTILEGHTKVVVTVAFSPSGRLLASAAYDGTVRLWRSSDWVCVATVRPGMTWAGGLSFHPHEPLLVVTDSDSRQIDLWRIDEDVLLGHDPTSDARRYVNAKVVLLGDTGVGKSGLGLVLSGQPYRLTDSTHARNVWTCDQEEVETPTGPQTREVLVWDLAGQPGYRLVHQLHLNEVAVALVVFDARSETDPFAGVKHWMRALAQARRLEGEAAVPVRTFLVAARADRGGVGVSTQRVEAAVRELGMDGFFETSAKRGWQVTELTEAVRSAVDWDALPFVSSNTLFEGIRSFLLDEKQDGLLLATTDDLYRTYRRSVPEPDEDNRAAFETCIGRLEGRGLIRRLHFGDYVLLQPELLDAYASALVQAAKDEPDGLGFVAEEDALAGRFRLAEDERIGEPKAERLLLIAMVEELLRHEVALKEVTDRGVDLVFPAQFTRERPDAPDVPGREVTFAFEGPLHNVYATLAVRLARSRLFTRDTMWRNAATFRATVGGMCGIYLREIEEGRGELALSFDAVAEPIVRSQFEAYVHEHLTQRAGSVTRRRTRSCPGCRYVLPDDLVRRRLDRGSPTIKCPACEEHDIDIWPEDAPTPGSTDSAVSEMRRSATRQRDRDVAATRLKGKIETGDHDVFLCYSSPNRERVIAVAEQLKERGILPWLDVWDLRPGTRWQSELARQLASVRSVAVFVGPGRRGPWQEIELETALSEIARRRRPIIPVILEGVRGTPTLPPFLRLWQSVDLRKLDPDPVDRLAWGITGERRVP